jgi:hypothetical protein
VLELSSVRGEVRLRPFGGRIRASSVHGDVRLDCTDLPRDADLSLASTNGDVVVTVAAGARTSLTAASVHGAVSVEGEGGALRRGRGTRLSEELGGGGGRLRLASVNGSVRVVRRPVPRREEA